MKCSTFATIVLAIVLAAGGFVHYQFVQDLKRGFTVRSRSAAGAIFLTKDGHRKFICSGTVFAVNPATGDALFLTARHCVWNDGDPDNNMAPGLVGKEEVSFTPNEEGPFYTAIPYKVSKTDDVAILTLKNGAGLPFVRLGDEHFVRPGDTLTNYTFALDMGEMDIFLKSIAPAFNHLPEGLAKNRPMWAHSMPIDGTVAPGSSGSGLFDPRQRRIVGVAVGMTRMGGLSIAIPVSRVWNLLTDPNTQDLTPPTDAPVVPIPDTASIRIPDDVFKAQFGKAHTFKLDVQGASPQFTFGGYVFKAVTYGYPLSPKYYYDVPVYIDLNDAGKYRLTSTEKYNYSVEAVVVSKVS